MCDSEKQSRPDWSKVSDGYRKHRLASKRDWIVSNAKKMSLDDPPNSQFDPHVLGTPSDVIQLELACIDDGIPLTDLSNETANQHKFYLDCRKQFNNPAYVVGYCSGEKAPYILVKWKSSGGFHGQPASETYLKKIGVKL